MKIRSGFVSNSSSTSFVCVLCGDVYAVNDGESIEDYDLVCCENCWNKFHKECAPNKEEIERHLSEEEDASAYDLPEKYCPICSFRAITQEDFIKYVSRFIISEEKVLEEIRGKGFKNYKDFKRFLDEV